MKTNSGLWDIINETRYNTEDLVGIFNAYEKAITDLGRPLKAVDGGRQGTVRFRDYSPATIETHTRGFVRAGERVYEAQRALVRRPAHGCSWERVAGIVRPSKLYNSPLEALAAVTDRGEEAPGDLSQAIWFDVVRDCYDVDFSTWVWVRDATVLPAIRIMRRRESAPSGAPVRAEFLNRMYRSTSSMSWELYKSERRVGKIIGESAYYASVSGKIGYEDTGIHEIALELEQLQAELRQLIKAEITKVNIERRRNAER
jgi:hypothetical protein